MKFDLLTTVEQGGCSAKLPAQLLDELIRDLPRIESENLLIGTDTHDDAAVWKINDETALIFTTDFFPPVCGDPYTFGEIAAANALSDIYAMGGVPIMALNLAMFPSDKIDISVLKEILEGGAAKVKEAGAVLGGGHTIDDYPPKYGLAVNGIVHPDRIISNNRAAPGDRLILTKPIGTGTLMAGQRIGEAKDEDYKASLDSMKRLNKECAELMQKYDIHCATDITGFSLLGHGLEMAEGSGCMLRIDSTRIPLLKGAYELTEMGCIPGASFRNLSYVESRVMFEGTVDYNLKMLSLDAQTSGGILLCCPVDKVNSFLSECREVYPHGEVIGEVIEGSDHLSVKIVLE